jgi:hypothetical protein
MLWTAAFWTAILFSAVAGRSSTSPFRLTSAMHAHTTQDGGVQTIRGRGTDGSCYEFEWHRGWMLPRRNHSGTTGWATIISSTNPACRPQTQCRIHLCAHSPCIAIWSASRYGAVGPPIHVQEVQGHPPAVAEAVAELPGPEQPPPAAANTAVAASSNEPSSPAVGAAPVGPLPVAEPAQDEEPARERKRRRAEVLRAGVSKAMAVLEERDSHQVRTLTRSGE